MVNFLLPAYCEWMVIASLGLSLVFLRMWDELQCMRNGWSSSWCMGEDFNDILGFHERSTSVCSSNAKREFHDFINYFALVDPPLKEGE